MDLSYLGHEELHWLATNAVLSQFSQSIPEANYVINNSWRKAERRNTVIEEVCKLYKLDREDLTAPGKGRLASEAKAVAAWIVRELPDLNLVDLGLVFKRDAATLILN